MKYRGIELKEITTPQICNPPKRMLVWDEPADGPEVRDVYAIVNRGLGTYPVITQYGSYRHCAEIPETKLTTNRELARWLSQGSGEMRTNNGECMVYTTWRYDNSKANEPIDEAIIVRKWADAEWHSPTREYLGLEG